MVEATSLILPSTVTAGARRTVEQRLYALPRLCEKLERAGNQEAAAITQEIDSIKYALQVISRDPYYPLVFLHVGALVEEIAVILKNQVLILVLSQLRTVEKSSIRKDLAAKRAKFSSCI